MLSVRHIKNGFDVEADEKTQLRRFKLLYRLTRLDVRKIEALIDDSDTRNSEILFEVEPYFDLAMDEIGLACMPRIWKRELRGLKQEIRSDIMFRSIMKKRTGIVSEAFWNNWIAYRNVCDAYVAAEKVKLYTQVCGFPMQKVLAITLSESEEPDKDWQRMCSKGLSRAMTSRRIDGREGGDRRPRDGSFSRGFSFINNRAAFSPDGTTASLIGGNKFYAEQGCSQTENMAFRHRLGVTVREACDGDRVGGSFRLIVRGGRCFMPSHKWECSHVGEYSIRELDVIETTIRDFLSFV